MKIFMPIKEHSERVPSKNFRELGAMPLWERAVSMMAWSEMYIDTDSKDILDACREGAARGVGGVLAYERLPEHCGDDVSVNLLIRRFLDEYVTDEEEPIVQIHCTAPFLTFATVEQAVCKWLMWKGKAPLIGVTVEHARFWDSTGLENTDGEDGAPGCWPVNHDPSVLLPTQKLCPLYKEASFLYVTSKRLFEKAGNNRVSRSTNIMFPLNYPECLDIDTEDDWLLCEAEESLHYGSRSRQ